MRRAVYFVCATASPDARGGCADFLCGPPAARLGFWSPQKKRRPGHFGSLCAYKKPTLPRQLYNGTGFYHRLGQVVAWSSFCRVISWHLFTRHARRIRDAGTTVRGYAEAVPVFLPRITPYRSGQARIGFDRSLYLRYREYRAALGLMVAWGFLVFKAYYLK